MTPADVLRKAVDVFGERGWRQGDRDGSRAVCAAEAAHVAAGTWLHPPTTDEGLACYRLALAAQAALIRHVHGERWRWTWRDVPRWNDQPGMSVEDVILAMKHAADLWEQENGVTA